MCDLFDIYGQPATLASKKEYDCPPISCEMALLDKPRDFGCEAQLTRRTMSSARELVPFALGASDN